MTLTIELPEALAKQIEEMQIDEALLQAQAVATIQEIVTKALPKAAIVSAKGKYAWVNTSSEEFAARKQAEKDAEERRWKK